jgi:Methylamine utilisation protein MauE
MTALALFLALVLATAAAQKAVDPARHGTAAARLTGATARLGPMLALAAGSLEALAALALLAPDTRRFGAGAVAGLWALYTALLLRRRGETMDCGCSLGARQRPVGPYAIARGGLLTGVALTVTLAPREPFAAVSVLAAAGLFSLCVAADQLAAIPPPAWRAPR